MVLANLAVIAAAAYIKGLAAMVAAVDIKTPIVDQVAKPLFDAAPIIVGIIAIIYLARQMQSHREGIGVLIAETGLFAGAGIGVLKVIQSVVGL